MLSVTTCEGIMLSGLITRKWKYPWRAKWLSANISYLLSSYTLKTMVSKMYGISIRGLQYNCPKVQIPYTMVQLKLECANTAAISTCSIIISGN